MSLKPNLRFHEFSFIDSHMAKQQSAMANQQTLNPTQTQNYQAGMMMQQMNPASVNQSGQGESKHSISTLQEGVNWLCNKV